MNLSGIYIYPVKGCRGIPLQTVQIDSLGLVGDRRFMIVDEAGVFVSQRTVPRLALLETRLTGSHLILSYGTSEYIEIHLRCPEPRLKSVQVWKSSDLRAEDAGDEPAAWLSSILRGYFRLVRIGPAFLRQVKAPSNPNDLLSFADAFPILIVGEGSLSNLNLRLKDRSEPPVPMNRFRPNLVVSGSEPYAEDGWPRLKIGALVFRAGGPCARCIVTTTEQATGERGVEPLRTLALYRRDPIDTSHVNFGQNYIHETKSGELKLGDNVQPI